MELDPWLYTETNTECPKTTKFEDDFVIRNSTGQNLPDSAEYIANLERKLNKIKKGSGKTQKEILNSLEEKRKDCMVRLLAENFIGNEEDVLDENIPTKWLKSHIHPQQPLTVGELVELVKADYLAKETEDPENSEPVGDD